MKQNSRAQTELVNVEADTRSPQAGQKNSSKDSPKDSSKDGKQGSQRHRKYRLSPLWLIPILGFFSVPWLVLYHRGAESRRQEAQIGVLSEAFFAEIDDHTKNESAAQFDRLTAGLGFLPNDALSLNSNPITPIDVDEQARYKAVEPLLNQMLAEQLDVPAQALRSPSPELKAYLDSIEPKRLALQAHLLAQAPPIWEVNLAQMIEEDYPLPGLANVLNSQKLLIVAAIAHRQSNQQSEMLAALEASWHLNQAIAQRPDLSSKILASTVADYQAALFRHVALPDAALALWRDRFAQIEQHTVIEGIRFDTWLQYGTLQSALSKALSGTPSEASSGTPLKVNAQSNRLANFSPIHQFKLDNIEKAQSTHRAIDLLSATSVCQRSQTDMEAHLKRQNSQPTEVDVSAMLARRWKLSGDRALSLELTQQVLDARAHYQQHSRWPAPTDVKSTACPNEVWMQKITDAGAMEIRLSVEPVSAAPPSISSRPLQISLTPTDPDSARPDSERSDTIKQLD